jgi:hypothetical protein
MKFIVCLTGVLSLAVAASAATIQIDPASSTIMAGGGAVLNVRITDVTDLYAFQFDLAFDPAILSKDFVPITVEGAFLSAGGGTVFLPGILDNTVGTVTLIAGTLTGPVPGVSGSGTLVSVSFLGRTLSTRPIATSPITLSNITLLDSAGNDIAADVQNGSVTVITPEPNAALLLLGVMGLGFLRRIYFREKFA